MTTKIIYFVFALLVSVAGTAQDSSKFEPQLNTVLKAFQNQDVSKLNTVLAENFTIAGMPKGFEKQILPQLVEQLPPFDSYKVTKVEEETNGTRVYLYFVEPKTKEQVTSNFLFNKKNKIQEFNLLDDSEITTQVIGQ